MIPEVVASETGRAQTLFTSICLQIDKLVDECKPGVVRYQITRTKYWPL
jgi:hypothetical protein